MKELQQTAAGHKYLAELDIDVDSDGTYLDTSISLQVDLTISGSRISEFLTKVQEMIYEYEI